MAFMNRGSVKVESRSVLLNVDVVVEGLGVREVIESFACFVPGPLLLSLARDLVLRCAYLFVYTSPWRRMMHSDRSRQSEIVKSHLTQAVNQSLSAVMCLCSLQVFSFVMVG